MNYSSEKNKNLKNNRKHIKVMNYTGIIFSVIFMTIFLAGCGKEEDNKKTVVTKVNQEQTATATDVAEADTVPLPVTEEQTSLPVMDEYGFYLANDYVKTVGDTINVRTSPSTSASIYMLLTPDQVLPRTGYSDEWTRVEIDNTNFYIYSDYVEITDAPASSYKEETTDNQEKADEDKIPKVKKIVIDPGNQANMNASIESVGPGSSDTKVSATQGFTGSTLGTREYEINLLYAKQLKMVLEERGYEVIITRETDDVNLSNKKRAELANESAATAFVRIKMNYSTNAQLSGVMAVTMSAASPYNSELYDESNKLATRILQGLIEETQATNHGILETEEMTAINWSNIPVAVIELGYLSNPADENNLVSEEYRNKVIEGLANGIDYYFND